MGWIEDRSSTGDKQIDCLVGSQTKCRAVVWSHARLRMLNWED
jgi:hypothetical protein